MGQKINQNIFQINQTKQWKSKWFETKTKESSICSYKDQAIWKFICKFFKILNVYVNHCSLFHLNQTFQMFISCHLDLKHFYKQNQILFKLNKLNYAINIHSFLEKLFVSLINFSKKRTSYFLIMQKLNSNFKNFVTKKIKWFLKKKLASLRKFKQIQFFEKSINTFVSCISSKKSSKLLAKFISTFLKNLKYYNFFVWFIWNTLKFLIISPISKIAGIKINIKGWLNNQPRASVKWIDINKSVSLVSVNYKINYSEEIAHTSNGTVGVKIWTYDL